MSEKIGPYMTAVRIPCTPMDIWMIDDSNGRALATVEWYPKWRQWTLSDIQPDAVFSADCLASLATWMEDLCKS